jgi:hypothetical protein
MVKHLSDDFALVSPDVLVSIPTSVFLTLTSELNLNLQVDFTTL